MFSSSVIFESDSFASLTMLAWQGLSISLIIRSIKSTFSPFLKASIANFAKSLPSGVLFSSRHLPICAYSSGVAVFSNQLIRAESVMLSRFSLKAIGSAPSGIRFWMVLLINIWLFVVETLILVPPPLDKLFSFI